MITAVRYALRPMVFGDIPQAVSIERESFPTLWPQTTYRRELQNRLARYIVAVEVSEASLPAPPPAPERPGGWREAVRRLLGTEPQPPPTSELILGFVGLWLMVGEAHIVTLAVREAYRRRGIGETLLIAALEVATRNGQETMTLEVRRSNEAAQALYEKYGFLRVRVRPRYYSDTQEDAILMSVGSLQSPEYGDKFRRLKEAHHRRWGDAVASLPAHF